MVKNLIPWRRKTESKSSIERISDPFESLHQQVNELFDDLLQDFDEKPGRWPALRPSKRSWVSASPSIDVSESEDEVRVKAELPGMDEEDIEVVLDENVLTIRGEKKEERENKKRNRHIAEVRYGQFSRSIFLPDGIDHDKAKAKFKKGVLTLTLPKSETEKSSRKRIDVSTE